VWITRRGPEGWGGDSRKRSRPSAEDDPVNAELFRDLLESESWEVEIAEDGEVTLAKMAAYYYDLLLLDLGMPKVSGVDVLRRLQRGDIGRPGRIVVVTADPLCGIREALASLGADALLSKPSTSGHCSGSSWRRTRQEPRVEGPLCLHGRGGGGRQICDR